MKNAHLSLSRSILHLPFSPSTKNLLKILKWPQKPVIFPGTSSQRRIKDHERAGKKESDL